VEARWSIEDALIPAVHHRSDIDAERATVFVRPRPVGAIYVLDRGRGHRWMSRLRAFMHIESHTGPRTLNRVQQSNSARIFGGVQRGVTKEECLCVLEAAAQAAGGSNAVTDYAGESRQILQEGAALTATLAFAVVLIYLVLAAQFHSFRDPLIVLLGSVPLAISGALVFTFMDLTTINIYSQVGLITLVGLIAKNGILIVEFANTLQARRMAKVAGCARPRSLDCGRC
jgi:multidrug efflux pump